MTDDEKHDDDYFGERVAQSYDEAEAAMFRPDVVAGTVDVLSSLAGNGPALEFGVGTGRIALPLAARGVPVHGVDLSRAMTDRLRAKPGGDAVDLTTGDFATTRVPGSFTLVYLLFNTLMNLTTQEAQVACFRNAANHLAPGGAFVVEVMMPELRKIPTGQSIVHFAFGPRHWAWAEYDVATQSQVCHYVDIADGRGEHRTTPFRYVWPAELDLMAQLAGLRLRSRREDWDGRPFTSESDRHVSVWEKPAA